MSNFNILFLSVGRRVELVKSFRKAMKEENVFGKLIGVDLQDNAPALYFVDECYKICAVKDDKYIDELIELCKNLNVRLVIPTIDTELEILSKHRMKIENATGARIMVSNEDVIKIIRDKRKTYEFLKENGFKTPRVINENDLQRKNYTFPLFIKPLDGSSSVNNFKINNEEELNFFKKYVSNPLIQEFIEGEEYCVDVFNDFEGNVITIVPKLRLASRAGEIMKGTIVKDKKIIEIVKEIMNKLKPSGEVNVDCIVNEKGVYIIEINGRFAGGAPMSFEAGANSPVNLLKILKGEKLNYNDNYKDGMLALRFDECIFIGGK